MTETNRTVPTGFASFAEFYPFYLGEHRDQTCKLLHFLGTSMVITALASILITQDWTKLWLIPICGYGPAWLGHFAFEKNRPASFKWPLYSLRGDFVMFADLLRGRLSFRTGAELER